MIPGPNVEFDLVYLIEFITTSGLARNSNEVNDFEMWPHRPFSFCMGRRPALDRVVEI